MRQEPTVEGLHYKAARSASRVSLNLTEASNRPNPLDGVREFPIKVFLVARA